ncbi:MAG: V-type ATP synthase subunit E family protein [Candidatus Woesearchaeota archaeon]|jgi:vacuolar-type H+-ATPase subunit E/Vma4|nr:V-type ATP synthase subunit E family protein [Candidatus Woesearchaeota archaeon]MDP7323338.1 V-type ATP synthase subunit E family protein [Candidatus Woesearchaeota archaeon]MDP7457347.1 V-type ATP synthase subunit E family protein [Candidatus Woesearchaeota archaeon]
MGIEELKQQLLKEAEQKAKTQEVEAEKQAKQIAESTAGEAKSYAEEMKRNAETMLATAEKKELAAAEFEGKKGLLDKKKEIIDRVVEQAKQDLQELPSAQRKKMVQTLLSKAKKEIPVKHVYLDKKDMSLVKEKGIKVSVESMVGGLIAETDDGKIIVDLRFETLLEQTRDVNLQKLGEVLFGG